MTDSIAYSLCTRTRQLTQDGCAGFLNPSNKRLASTSLLHAVSWKRKWQIGSGRVGGRDGGGGLKQEMTSIPSAEQLATIIRNGKWEKGERVILTCQQKKTSCCVYYLWCEKFDINYQFEIFDFSVCYKHYQYIKNLQEYEKAQWWKWAKRHCYDLSFFSVRAVLVW